MKFNIRKAIVAVGIWNGLMFIFHCFFPIIFRWGETLTVLNRFDWAIFQTYHLIMLLMAAFMTYVSVRYPAQLLESPLGGLVLLTCAMVSIIRMAAELLFFGFSGIPSLIIIVFSIIPAGVYLLAFSMRPKPAVGGQPI